MAGEHSSESVFNKEEFENIESEDEISVGSVDEDKKTAVSADKKNVLKVPTVVDTLQFDIIYQYSFKSRMLWEIGESLGTWSEDERNTWETTKFDKSKTVSDQALAKQVLKKTIKKKEITFVLVDFESGSRWICVGEAKKRPLKEEYKKRYQYATCRGIQYGVKGVVTVTYKGKSQEYKVMVVTHKTRWDGSKSGEFTFIGPGEYKGRVQVRGKYATKYGKNGLYNSKSFYVTHQKEKGKWLKGARRGPNSKTRTENCFIHPAQFPDHLDGCIALGTKFSNIGFESWDNSVEALSEVFKMININTKKDYQKTQALSDKLKPKFLLNIKDERTPVVLKEVNGPEQVNSGCTAVYTAIRLPDTPNITIKWLIVDSETNTEIDVFKRIVGDRFIIDRMPLFGWGTKKIDIIAYTHDVSENISKTTQVNISELGEFVLLVKQVESITGWTGEEVLNSLRRLFGTDSKNFQKLYGTQPALDLFYEIINEDIINRLLYFGLHDHDSVYVPQCFAKHCFDEEISISHVLTGISAGQHRNKAVDLGVLALGEYVDNLYAATIAGDLGQSACYVNEGKQKPGFYIGDNTEAHEHELIGDIDGFLIGLNISSLCDGKNLFIDLKLSELLEKYYFGQSQDNVTATWRYRDFKSQGMISLFDQTFRFAETYRYALGFFDGLVTNMEEDSKKAVNDFSEWLKKKIIDENKRNSA